jgi:hypothetical protein
MKRVIFSLIFFTFFSLASDVSAQDTQLLQIPGIDCGVANSPTLNKCCHTTSVKLPGRDVAVLVTGVPIIGDKAGVYSHVSDSFENIQNKYAVRSACLYGTPSTDITDSSCSCILATDSAEVKPITDLCKNYKFANTNEQTVCINCARGGGFWSGMGCVPLRLENFITNFLLSFGIGLGGFVALICIILSVFTIQTSGGNPEKLKKAQENITSCILGLILIIFSIFILRLIGVEVLGIPFLR